MIWIIGSGIIAQEYAKILFSLGKKFIVIGRGNDSAKRFEEDQEIKVHRGGFANFLSQNLNEKPSHAIIATNLTELHNTLTQALDHGVSKILIEKPGALFKDKLKHCAKLEKEKKGQVCIAYNRRFYSSVGLLKKLIEKDGGLQSFHFEFTERSHIVKNLGYPREVLDAWFFANSTHVIDLAFSLGGFPSQLFSVAKGVGQESWHSNANIFTGSGVSSQDIPFSYHSNWSSAGGWKVEFTTSQNRYLMCPIEQLKVIAKGESEVVSLPLDEDVDKGFKHGFYQQTTSFLMGNLQNFCMLEDQVDHWNVYETILHGGNYSKSSNNT